MHIKHLEVTSFRNISNINLEFNPKINFFHGCNGSGKTSILESIYYLGLGRSFRSHLNSRLIQQGTEKFSIFSKIISEQQPLLLPIGVERDQAGNSRIRIANENAKSILDITKLLPLQLLNPDSHQILHSGSKLRRQFLDWGVFHVEPAFLGFWQSAQRALKQRNAALKNREPTTLIEIWSKELNIAALGLNELRRMYFANLRPIFMSLIDQLFEGHNYDVNVSYYSGWQEGMQLLDVLNHSIDNDLKLGYTRYGPQRADIILKIGKIPLHDILSQGQQKLIIYALSLSQGILHYQLTGKSCIYLLDDLTAELDSLRLEKILDILRNKMQAQIFITSVDMRDLEKDVYANDSFVFHVEQGHVRHQK